MRKRVRGYFAQTSPLPKVQSANRAAFKTRSRSSVRCCRLITLWKRMKMKAELRTQNCASSSSPLSLDSIAFKGQRVDRCNAREMARISYGHGAMYSSQCIVNATWHYGFVLRMLRSAAMGNGRTSSGSKTFVSSKPNLSIIK